MALDEATETTIHARPPSGEITEPLDIEAVLADASMRIAFQPICDLRSLQPIGYEALARFPGEHPGPLQWFNEASRIGLLQPLELHAVAAALTQLPLLPEAGFLAVNISPPTAASKAFGEMVSGVPPDRLVLEITEHAVVENYRQFAAAIEYLRSFGVRIALDDAGGSPDVGLQHLIYLKPDILKIDVTVVRGIVADEMRQAVAAAYVNLAQRAGALVIAEGVETDDELAVLLGLGIEVGQGYLLGRPEFLNNRT